MANTNSNSAQKSDRIYLLPRAVYTGTDAPITVRDPIYPRKTDVGRGSVFMFYGHSIEVPTRWVVENIVTVTGSGRNRVRSNIHNVRSLDDYVELRCEQPFTRKSVQFRWLSVSAAWRLAE